MYFRGARCGKVVSLKVGLEYKFAATHRQDRKLAGSPVGVDRLARLQIMPYYWNYRLSM